MMLIITLHKLLSFCNDKIAECLEKMQMPGWLQTIMHYITKTCPCNIQRSFTAVKMKNFR